MPRASATRFAVDFCDCDPDLRLPRDFGQVLRHSLPCQERSHKDQPSLGLFEQVLQLVMSLETDGTMACDSLDKHKPVLLRQMNDNVGHFAVFVERQSQPLEVAFIKMSLFLTGVPDIS